jgi:hypothetical protein
VRVLGLGRLRDLLHLTLAEQGGRPDRAHAERLGGDDVDANRLGKAFRLLYPGVGRPSRTLSRELGYRDDRTLASRDLGLAMTVILVQDLSS